MTALAPTDFSSIRGQEAAKRTLAVAAAGGHHALLIGPPGSGKTHLAWSVPGLFAPLRPEQLNEVEMAYARAKEAMPAHTPFRVPDSGVTASVLLGRRSPPQPGEASLASGGVLLLDDVDHFAKKVLERLSPVMSSRRITLASSRGTVCYPARFTLIGTMTPCPCGFHGDWRRKCTCTPAQLVRRWQKVPNSFLDRIDLYVPVLRLTQSELAPVPQSGERVRERVRWARKCQVQRTGARWNSELTPAELDTHCLLHGRLKEVLDASAKDLGWTVGACLTVRRLARTIADLAGSERVEVAHLAEAIQYRSAGVPAAVQSLEDL